MKGWSAAFVTKQVCIRGFRTPGVCLSLWSKADEGAADSSNDKCLSRASALQQLQLCSFFIAVCVLTLNYDLH